MLEAPPVYTKGRALRIVDTWDEGAAMVPGLEQQKGRTRRYGPCAVWLSG